ncbi:MAG: undecaprenyl-diphosphate phosphatase [Caldilineales bacterium]|nr:undecaprenyl-diphosphate phosphatase [Caldilineales bacterium]
MGIGPGCARPAAWPRGDEAKWRLALAIVIGVIPAAVIGYLFESFFEAMFSQPTLVAAMLLVTGAILILAETWKRGGLPLANIRLSDAAVIGLAQAAAIIPGISRSGATIAAGLLRGLDRPAAARYSFLLSAPIIGAGSRSRSKTWPAPASTPSA